MNILCTYPFDDCVWSTNIDWKSGAISWSAFNWLLFFGDGSCDCSSNWFSMFCTSFVTEQLFGTPPPFVCRAKRWWGLVAVVVCVWSLTSLMIGRGDEAWAGEEIDDWRWLTGAVNAGAIATVFHTFGLQTNEWFNDLVGFYLDITYKFGRSGFLSIQNCSVLRFWIFFSFAFNQECMGFAVSLRRFTKHTQFTSKIARSKMKIDWGGKKNTIDVITSWFFFFWKFSFWFAILFDLFLNAITLQIVHVLAKCSSRTNENFFNNGGQHNSSLTTGRAALVVWLFFSHSR